MNKMSEKVGEIAKALCKAQAELSNVVKDKQGYGYKYADLASCLDAVREPFTRNGLAISQLPQPSPEGKLVLDTLLLHESGEWILSTTTVPLTPQKGLNDAQVMGSAMTYARRYALASIAGLAQEDDDAASVGTKPIIEKDTTCETLTKLKELCQQENISVKAFARYFGLSRSNTDSLKQAVSHFTSMAEVFKSSTQEAVLRII